LRINRFLLNRLSLSLSFDRCNPSAPFKPSKPPKLLRSKESLFLFANLPQIALDILSLSLRFSQTLSLSRFRAENKFLLMQPIKLQFKKHVLHLIPFLQIPPSPLLLFHPFCQSLSLAFHTTFYATLHPFSLSLSRFLGPSEYRRFSLIGSNATGSVSLVRHRQSSSDTFDKNHLNLFFFDFFLFFGPPSAHFRHHSPRFLSTLKLLSLRSHLDFNKNRNAFSSNRHDSFGAQIMQINLNYELARLERITTRLELNDARLELKSLFGGKFAHFRSLASAIIHDKLEEHLGSSSLFCLLLNVHAIFERHSSSFVSSVRS
jgi:hypothetical protein